MRGITRSRGALSKTPVAEIAKMQDYFHDSSVPQPGIHDKATSPGITRSIYYSTPLHCPFHIYPLDHSLCISISIRWIKVHVWAYLSVGSRSMYRRIYPLDRFRSYLSHSSSSIVVVRVVVLYCGCASSSHRERGICESDLTVHQCRARWIAEHQCHRSCGEWRPSLRAALNFPV